MCTGRVDMAFILHAFAKGADGVFIGGCWLGECHYVTEGNFEALSTKFLCKKLLERVGINPDRLRLEWISASEGVKYAEVMNDFGRQLKDMGPLGKGEGLDKRALQLKLEAVTRLAPYAKLVERERLRVRFENEQAYEEYFASDEVNRLIDELLVDKLTISQILLLLRETPLPAKGIAQALGLTPSEVSRHLHSSTKHGLISFDQELKHYALT
jgi:coenzyme F420-reducing hydrogenase delta subunit